MKFSSKFYQTPQYLFDMGMCLCPDCGKLHSVDYRFCNDCLTEIMIDVVPGEKTDDAKILNTKNKNKNSQALYE